MPDPIDELPIVADGGRGRAPTARSSYDGRARVGRRALFGTSVRIGAVAGVTMLGLFRSVRRAAADTGYAAHPSCGRYDPDRWNGFDGNDNGFVEPGTCDDDVCVGAPDDAMGSWYCVACEEVDANNPYGWHFTGRRGPFLYGDATDLCSINGVGIDPRDAWKWQVSTCGDCTPAVYRCHDGWKLDPGGEVTATVCQGLVECNGSLYAPC
jgi:hypothetical protein